MKLFLHRLDLSESGRKKQHGEAYFLLSEALFAETGQRHQLLNRDTLGKPGLEGGVPAISLTHCAGLVACGVRAEGGLLGVDAEPIRSVRPGVARRCFSAGEQAALSQAQQPDLYFTRLWTLKESFIKAIGKGISFPMAAVTFSLTEDRIAGNRTEFGFAQILTEDGFVVSLCAPGLPGVVLRPKGEPEWDGFTIQ